MTGHVFISGGTGYIGTRLIPRLLAEGCRVRTLARRNATGKLPPGCEVIYGDALRADTFAGAISGADTFVHMVGVKKPAPWKSRQFRSIDLEALKASVTAATAAKVRHFVYVSVAHPAPVMKDYVAVRMECEEIVRHTGMNATFVRPWHVLGPGHRWPHLIQPLYALAGQVPAWRKGVGRLGLVTLDQMVEALAWSVANPAAGERVLEVPEIRDARLRITAAAASASN